MQVEIDWLARSAFAAHARGHVVVSDQPAANGGGDTGMTPPELLLVSLGSCVGYYVAEFCRARGIPFEELRIKVSAETLHTPARLGNIVLDVTLPAELEEARLEALRRAATRCTIHNTLAAPPDIDVRIHTLEAAGRG